MLSKLFLGHFRYLAIRRVFIWVIHKMHFNIAEELIEFGENDYNGNFKPMC